jgi:hypothetical protein
MRADPARPDEARQGLAGFGSATAGMAPKAGSRVFLRFDSPSRGRLLQAATLSEIQEDRWTLSFESRHHAVDIGEERLVYYNQAREFMQQRVRIEAQSSSGPRFVLSVQSIGGAVSAGTREEDRVSTLGTGLTATIQVPDRAMSRDRTVLWGRGVRRSGGDPMCAPDRRGEDPLRDARRLRYRGGSATPERFDANDARDPAATPEDHLEIELSSASAAARLVASLLSRNGERVRLLPRCADSADAG